MKKILIILIVLMMVFSVSCNGNSAVAVDSKKSEMVEEEEKVEPTPTPTPTPEPEPKYMSPDLMEGYQLGIVDDGALTLQIPQELEIQETPDIGQEFTAFGYLEYSDGNEYSESNFINGIC